MCYIHHLIELHVAFHHQASSWLEKVEWSPNHDMEVAYQHHDVSTLFCRFLIL